ncbi:hypothetical protein HRED_04919, partial [Candidatus Haloredivivus sp. G17]
EKLFDEVEKVERLSLHVCKDLSEKSKAVQGERL